MAGVAGVGCICALFGRSLAAVSGTRLNAHLRKHGRRPLSNGYLKDLDASEAFAALCDQVSRLVVAVLAGVLMAGGAMSPGGAAGLAVGCAAFFVLFLEVVPRTVARVAPDRLVTAALPLLRLIGRLFAPFMEVCQSVERFTVRASGGDLDRHTEQAVEEELLSAAEEGEREGVIEVGAKEMIESIVSFYDAEVREVMTPRTSMVCIGAETTLPEGIQIATTCGHSRIPVYRENRDTIIGILYVKDLLRHVNDQRSAEKSIGQIVRKAYFVPESKKISQLFQEFRDQRFHIAVVLDEYGGTSGLVTIEDILEEIVGEIADEYELGRDGELLRRLDEQTAEVDGRIHIDELNEGMGLELPEDDSYETLAGFLFGRWGRIPQIGEGIAYDKVHFEVLDADERRIKSVRIRVGSPT